MRSFLHIAGFVSVNHVHPKQQFDATKGYPGEGPEEKHLWSIYSANIGSLKTASCWKTWKSAITCMQETRIGKNCINSARHSVAQCGKTLFPGALLPGLLASNGVRRTPHGGVAVAAPAELCTPFVSNDDASGKYQSLFNTKRVQAVWVQVSSSLKALVFNVYCKTGARQDRDILDSNNGLLSDVFCIASQFGDIPVFIAGDLQTEPLQYQAVMHACNFLQWCDPIAHLDPQSGNRPLTFSANGTFSGYGDGCSSIDAILVNKVAASSVVQAEVLSQFKTQHRPIKLTLSWERVWQCGFVLYKTAPFELHALSTCSDTPPNEDPPWTDADDIESCWNQTNHACINTLLENGATWGPGPKTRGLPVKFRPKKICPGQKPHGVATTLVLSWLYNALGGLREIERFLSRNLATQTNSWIQHRTFVRVWNRLARLRAPCLWPPSRRPNLVDVTVAIQWVQDRITTQEIKLKLQRIKAWQDKIQDSAKLGSAFLFRHLKNKTHTEPANLVVDSLGNAIFDPGLAMHEINNQWDPIFSANLGYPHALKMLEIVWPHIHHFHLDYPVPELCAADLKSIVKKRKKEAAPGLDGWRTTEMQVLPDACFAWFAALFRRLETNDEPLPKILSTARQIILNKNGSSEPLQKRLITLLPVILLAYTGARFVHLKHWQMVVMPHQLQGGIPKRHMAAIHTRFALSLDHNRNEKCDLIGVKIDKAKCFDRIIPSYAAALMLAFGVPKRIVVMFVKIYQDMSKHLSYKAWVQPQSTHGPNGVAQGCSLSLIAINVHMKVWIHLLDVLPSVTAQAFVDDAYLWTKLINKHQLAQAIRITQMWDELAGQSMNASKCVVWGSSSTARKEVKSLFPDMQCALEIEILGVHIQTSNRTAMHFSDDKTAKIIADVRNISCLPISCAQKAKIIGAKVIPQCTYNAAINMIPARALARIQGEIVTSLWKNRPHWRAKFLVFAFLCKPHRVEPMCARHYNSILDVCRYLQLFPCERLRFNDLLKSCHHKHAIVQRVRDAFAFFHIDLRADGMLALAGKPLCALHQLGHRDVRPVLQQLAKHVCYEKAGLQSRKDIRNPTGILDFWLSTSFLRNQTARTEGEIPDSAFFEAQLVGCVLTNDRLAAAKRVEHSTCRMCSSSKESLPHLVRECTQIRHDNPPPPAHELGANFELLGIVEHPVSVLLHRLQVSDPSAIPPGTWDPHQSKQTLWTDGSVQWPTHFMLSCAGFAVVNSHGVVVQSGPVQHWNLSSYTAELWAAIWAFATASGPIQIRTDCKSLANHFNELVGTEDIKEDWPLTFWWQFVLTLFTARRQLHACPLECVWIPAHTLEGTPEYLLTPAAATQHGTTVTDIVHNRRADSAAKKAALSNAAIHQRMYDTLCSCVKERQEWLTQLSKMIGTTAPPRELESDDEENVEAEDPVQRFPLLPWHEGQQNYTWQAHDLDTLTSPVGWPSSNINWRAFATFLCSLKWSTDPGHKVSYTELAVMLVQRRHKLDLFEDEFFTFASLSSTLKKWCRFLQKKLEGRLLPGSHDAHDHHAWGKTMPCGVILGGRPWRSPNELSFLVSVAERVTKANLCAWDFAVQDFLCD